MKSSKEQNDTNLFLFKNGKERGLRKRAKFKTLQKSKFTFNI